jgi:hypothetical protein
MKKKCGHGGAAKMRPILPMAAVRFFFVVVLVLYILITNDLEKRRLAREWEQLHRERMSGEERGRWERAAALARSRRQQQQQQANQQRIDNVVATIIDELDGPGPQQQQQPQLQQQPSTSRQQQQQPYLQEQPGTSRQQQQQPHLQQQPGTSRQAAIEEEDDDDRPLARLIAGLQGISRRMQQQMAEGAALEGGLTLARRREICMF